MAVVINETDYQEEKAKQVLALANRDKKIAQLQGDLDELTDAILENAPECMDGDAAAVSIAIDYVRSLEGVGQGAFAGHRDECNCFA
jgi:hypothetical protein